MSVVVGVLFCFVVMFFWFVWVLLWVLGYLKSLYVVFVLFFVYLSRLDVECWVYCVVDGYENGVMDVLKDVNWMWYCGMIEGDCDFVVLCCVVCLWEWYCDFFVIFSGVAYDGLRSYGDEIVVFVCDVFECVEVFKVSSFNM